MTERARRLPRPTAGIFLTLFAAMLAFAAALTLMGALRADSLRREIIHSYDRRGAAQALLTQVHEAEQSEHGYFLTRDRRMLVSYRQAIDAVAALQAKLEGATGEASVERGTLARLHTAIKARLATIAEGVAIAEQGEIGAARTLGLMHRAAGEEDAVRARVNALIDEERMGLDQRLQAATRFRSLRDAGIIGAILTAAGAMATFLWRDGRRQLAQASLLEELEEAAARQKIIFDSAVDAIITLNPSGSIETINAAGLRLFGYTEEQLLRRDISVLMDLGPEARGAFLTRLQAVGSLSSGFIKALDGRTSTGGYVPLDVALSTMTLSDGVHVVAVVRDASERRAMEAMKDDFVATVSHELRTPLTSIAGSLGLLRGGAGGVLPLRAARLVEIAEANGARLVRLINDILDIEKIQSGTAHFERRPLQLRQLARTACEAMSGMAFERGVDLDVDPIDADQWILGDSDRMMQVLTNLLSNAIKVTPGGGKVRLTGEAASGRGLLRVTDEGPGVPQEFRARIFTPFAQADATDGRSPGGTGLGLSIVREIVERHGGAVGFESEPGHGAVFYIDLPLIEPPAEADEESLAHTPKILICEDDELVGEVLSGQIEVFGYKSDIVLTANEARHALHTGNYDAMLLDIRLPDSDGVTLMQALRASPNTATLPIIAMSGSAEFKARAEEQGIVDWLEKPIRMERLEYALKAALASMGAAAPLILHVDDDRDLAEVARARLGGIGEVVSVTSLAAARAILAVRRPNLVVLDLGLPDGRGDGLLNELAALPGGGPPTIIYTAQDIGAPPAPPVRAVLIKSRSDLPSLVRLSRKLIEEDSGQT